MDIEEIALLSVVIACAVEDDTNKNKKKVGKEKIEAFRQSRGY